MSKNVLFISEQTLKDRSPIDQNLDNKLITGSIKFVQDDRIQSILGTTLYEKIQNDIAAGTLAGNYKSLLDNYLTDVLIWFIVADLAMSSNFRFFNKGVLTFQSENATQVSLTDLEKVAAIYRARGEYYENRVIRYLRDQITANLFPEYINWRVGVDVIRPKYVGYTSTIPLEMPPQKVSIPELYQGDGRLIDFYNLDTIL